MLLPPSLHVRVLATEMAVCRLPAGSPVPDPPKGTALHAVVVTPSEVSVVCPADDAPATARVEAGWRVLKIDGLLDFSLVGILASVLNPLVDAHVSVFALSSFDTDYVLVKEDHLRQAVTALRVAGHRVDAPPGPTAPAAGGAQ